MIALFVLIVLPAALVWSYHVPCNGDGDTNEFMWRQPDGTLKCYTYFLPEVQFEQGVKACAQWDQSNLRLQPMPISLHSLEEENLARWLAVDVMNAENGMVWIGIVPVDHQDNPEGTLTNWEWYDQSPTDYQPYVKNTDASGYDCFRLSYDATIRWVNRHCTSFTYETICNYYMPFCNGYIANDTRVCNNGAGFCVGPEDCECTDPFHNDTHATDPFCAVEPVCAGVALSDGPCSGKGNCSFETNGTCECPPTWVEDDCSEKATCGEYEYDMTLACLGHGKCVGQDDCKCVSGYDGNNCELFECFDESSGDLDVVCSGNGVCWGIDRCQCEKNYYGEKCEEHIPRSYVTLSVPSSATVLSFRFDYHVPIGRLPLSEFDVSFPCTKRMFPEDYDNILLGDDSVCNWEIQWPAGHTGILAGMTYGVNVTAYHKVNATLCPKVFSGETGFDLALAPVTTVNQYERAYITMFITFTNSLGLSPPVIAGIVTPVILIIILAIVGVIVLVVVIVIAQGKAKKLLLEKERELHSVHDAYMSETRQMEENMKKLKAEGGGVGEFLEMEAPMLAQVEVADAPTRRSSPMGAACTMYAGKFKGAVVDVLRFENRRAAVDLPTRYKVEDLAKAIRDYATMPAKPGLLRVHALYSSHTGDAARWKAASKKNPAIVLLTEPCTEGAIMEHIWKKKADHLMRGVEGVMSVPLRDKAVWLQQIAGGVAALHTHGIILRNLNIESVFLDNTLHAKIIPSFPRIIGRNLKSSAFAAPEVVREYQSKQEDASVGTAADVYSFGVVAYCILAESKDVYPGTVKGGRKVAMKSPGLKALEGNRPSLEAYPIPQWARNLLTQCWEPNPGERITLDLIEQILSGVLFSLQDEGVAAGVDESWIWESDDAD